MSAVVNFMSKKVITVKPEVSIVEAAKLMLSNDIGFLPVVDDQDKVIGSLTDRDIVIRAVAKGLNINDLKVEKIMSKNPCFANEQDEAEDALKNMQERQIHRLLVRDKSDKLTGVISLGDVARATNNDQFVGKTVEKITEKK